MVILNGPFKFIIKATITILGWISFGDHFLHSQESFSWIGWCCEEKFDDDHLRGQGGFGFSVFSYTMALEMFTRRKNSRPSDDISAAFRDLASQRSYVRLVFLVGKSLDVYRKGMSSSLKPRSLSYSLRNWLLRILFPGSSSLLRSFLACLRSFLFTPRRRSCLVVAGLKYSRGIVLTSRVLSFSRRWVISL